MRASYAGGPSWGVALAQERVECPSRLALPALGSSGFRRRRPGIDVDVQPALGRSHEAVEKQRADDRTGEATGGDVVQVGHFGIEHRIIWAPEWEPPQRIVLSRGVAGEIGGERLVLGVERR